MADTKFTDGEWAIDKALTDGGAPIIVSDTCWLGNKRVIATVMYHNGSEDPEVIANAQLIAAAPDMYEALKYAEAFCEAVEQGLVAIATRDMVRDIIKEALAKVEGK